MPTPPAPEIPRPAASPGRSVRATWQYTLGSVVFILVVLDFILLGEAAAAVTQKYDAVSGLLLAAMVLAVVVQVRYCWFLRAGLGGGLPATGWTVALLGPAAIVWLLGWFTPGDLIVHAAPLWIAVALVAALLPAVVRWRLLAVAAVILVVTSLIVHGSAADWFPEDNVAARMLVIYALSLPVMINLSLWWWQVVVELDRHRVMAGELAVAQERLRFAADLHDIQGHHLQVIALKSELAERLLPINPEAALANIHETRLIAKQALEETRSLVAGYRETTLENELENAREVLLASGAECKLALEPLPGNPAVQHALAMSVREATTNILRHSDATLATISLSRSGGEAVLTVANNGLAGTPSDVTAAGFTTPGTGLAGLRERVEAVGGTLETSVGTDSFELLVRVPSEGIPA